MSVYERADDVVTLVAGPDFERAKRILDSAPWRFAKSMPTIPHEYVVRGRQLNVEDFNWLKKLIDDEGYGRKWGRRTYLYLNVDGWKLWYAHPVINRERLPET